MNLERKGRKLQKRFLDEDKDAQQEAIKTLLGFYPGRRFLWLWLSELGVFRTPYSTDPIEMARQCGEHSAGLRLLNLIVETDPKAFTTLTEESHNVNSRRNNEADRLRNADHPAGGDDNNDDY